MKKVFLLQDLDCAHCAVKMEKAASAIEGVHYASVSFLASTITIEAPDEIFQNVIEKVAKAIAKIEPDCTMSGIN